MCVFLSPHLSNYIFQKDIIFCISSFLAQIGTIFSALELRKVLAEAAASHSNVNYDLNR